ncbi:hypothetical protein GQ457_11G009340 [Hibiscus cannabinus]
MLNALKQTRVNVINLFSNSRSQPPAHNLFICGNNFSSSQYFFKNLNPNNFSVSSAATINHHLHPLQQHLLAAKVGIKN